MARPRKDDSGPSACERIKNAFWKMMEEKGYEAITIGALCRTAKVSPNTLYYHFANLEEVARDAFVENMPYELPISVLQGRQKQVYGQLAEKESPLSLRARRVMLFAGSDSGLLRSMATEYFIDAWLETLDVNRDELAENDLIALRFIASGVTAVLGSVPYDRFVPAVPDFLESPLGRGIVEELQSLGK